MKSLILTTLCFLSVYPTIGIAQRCTPSNVAEIPDSRYRLNDDGTVVDNKTGLMWMRCALGQTWSDNTCTGSGQTYTWPEALQVADTTTFVEQTDWRLPSFEELKSLVENRCYDPTINLSVFPNLAGYWFWTTSSYESDSSYARVVNFYHGYGNRVFKYEKDSSFVRLVRGGQ